MRIPPLPLLLSRLGIAACFLGFGIWEIVAPSLWTSYLPAFLASFNPIVLIVLHGIVLTAAGLGVLSGYYPRFFTGLSVLLLLEICVEILLQEGFTDILIRDVALLLFAGSLFADAMQKSRARS